MFQRRLFEIYLDLFLFVGIQPSYLTYHATLKKKPIFDIQKAKFMETIRGLSKWCQNSLNQQSTIFKWNKLRTEKSIKCQERDESGGKRRKWWKNTKVVTQGSI